MVFTDAGNVANWATKTTLFDPIGGVSNAEIVYDSGFTVNKGFFLGFQFGLAFLDGGDAFD